MSEKIQKSFLLFVLVLGAYWFFKPSFLKAPENAQKFREIIAPTAQSSEKAEASIPTANDESKQEPITRQPAASAAAKQYLDSYIKELTKSDKTQILKGEQGQITMITGFALKPEQKGEEGVSQFAHNLVSQWENVTLQPVQKLESNPLSDTYMFKQETQGYEVENGYMKIFTKKDTGEIYIVNSEIKDIGEPDLRKAYTLEQAKEEAVRQHADKQGVKVAEALNQPVILNLAPGRSELVWKMTLEIDGPLKDRRQVMVSASSGKVVFDKTTVRH